jgi:hypothetical protein
MATLTSAEVESKIKSGHFIIVDNENGTAKCWKMFGFPAHRPTDDSPQQKPKVLNDFAICKLCLKVLKHSGTKNLNEHMPVCPKKKDPGQSTLLASMPQKDQQIPATLKDKVKMVAVAFACCDMQPFSSVEGVNVNLIILFLNNFFILLRLGIGFRTLAQEMINVGAQHGKIPCSSVLPSRFSVKKEVMRMADIALDELREKIQCALQHKWVAFTTDLWTDSYKKIHYLDLTVFFIAENFELRHQILHCGEFSEAQKSAENIRKVVLNWLAEVGISEADLLCKSVPCTTDLGSNFVAAFKTDLRFDCMDHRLHTVLQTAWDRLEKSDDFELGREARDFRKSCHELVEFSKRAALSGLECSLKRDVVTRWNSFLSQLDSIQANYQCLFNILVPRGCAHLITRINKILLNQLIPFLSAFKEASDLLEQDSVPTLQHVPIVYYDLKNACEPDFDSETLEILDHPLLQVFKQNVLDTIEEKIAPKIKVQHYMATFLDPSLREFKFLPIESRDDKISYVKSFVRTAMNAMENTVPQSVSHVAHDEESSSSIATPPKKPKLSRYNRYRSSTNAPMDAAEKSVEQEMLEYLSSPIIAGMDQENPLTFWRFYATKLPRMAELAGRLYVVPASSSPSERSFSCAGRIIEERRTKLNPATTDAILRVRSHLMQNKEQQISKK